MFQDLYFFLTKHDLVTNLTNSEYVHELNRGKTLSVLKYGVFSLNTKVSLIRPIVFYTSRDNVLRIKVSR